MLHILLLILSLSKFVVFITAESSIYPSIYWNPWNPMFACEEPTINVRIGDTVNILCPSDEFNFFVPSSHINMIYENLYFLGNDRKKYDSCNATGTRKLLNCDNREGTTKLYTLSFREIQTSSDSLKFQRGQIYYLIGTGFRKIKNLGNKVNGSCSKRGNRKQYKMRLRIYVCTEEEVNSGTCNICKSAACYEKCSCTGWKDIGSSITNGSCFKTLSRNCTDPALNNRVKAEFKFVHTPNSSECQVVKRRIPTSQSPCSEWKNAGFTLDNGDCFKTFTRNCSDGMLVKSSKTNRSECRIKNATILPLRKENTECNELIYQICFIVICCPCVIHYIYIITKLSRHLSITGIIRKSTSFKWNSNEKVTKSEPLSAKSVDDNEDGGASNNAYTKSLIIESEVMGDVMEDLARKSIPV